MAKRVFFSFHYEDVKTFRANVVRNHDMLKERQEAGFFDWSIWEDAKRQGDLSLKGLINSSLENTSTTCALIGTETWQRRWVRYEIVKSYDRRNKLFGVHINGIKDKNGQTFQPGPNPFDYLGFVVSDNGQSLTYYEHDGDWNWRRYNDLPISKSVSFKREHWGKGFTLSTWVPIYDWVSGDGFHNFATWVENAQ